jgi:hypothetical protein
MEVKWCKMPEFKKAFEEKLKACQEAGLLPKVPMYEIGIPPMTAVQNVLAKEDENDPLT